jgi:hypothetical protein
MMVGIDCRGNLMSTNVDDFAARAKEQRIKSEIFKSAIASTTQPNDAPSFLSFIAAVSLASDSMISILYKMCPLFCVARHKPILAVIHVLLDDFQLTFPVLGERVLVLVPQPLQLIAISGMHLIKVCI